MFLNKSVNNLRRPRVDWKSNWFVKSSFNFKKHIYEDIFIRKYVSSFFFKWSKFYIYKVLGSFYLFRTFGKLYVNIYFFYPILRQKSNIFRKKVRLKQEVFLKKPMVKPVNKCKKHIVLLFLFYQLEKILKIQIFFKYRNICMSIFDSKLTTAMMLKINNFLISKFIMFKHQFKDDFYSNIIMFLLNLFKFKTPDAVLLANYIASVLPFIQEHNQFLLFIKSVLQTLKKVFKFNGVRLLLSGKLNGFTRAQSKQIQIGCVPLQNFNFPYLKGYSHVYTNAGKIGVKVWIC